jgi:hypothetical protein
MESMDVPIQTGSDIIPGNKYKAHVFRNVSMDPNDGEEVVLHLEALATYTFNIDNRTIWIWHNGYYQEKDVLSPYTITTFRSLHSDRADGREWGYQRPAFKDGLIVLYYNDRRKDYNLFEFDPSYSDFIENVYLAIHLYHFGLGMEEDQRKTLRAVSLLQGQNPNLDQTIIPFFFNPRTNMYAPRRIWAKAGARVDIKPTDFTPSAPAVTDMSSAYMELSNRLHHIESFLASTFQGTPSTTL